MIRDLNTTEQFRAVAKKAFGEVSFDRPGAMSFLEDVSGRIIDEGFSTGDTLIDALVALYGTSLTREGIDRLHKLDVGLSGMIGQHALVADRRLARPTESGKAVTVIYYAGRVNGETLESDLSGRRFNKGWISIPSTGHIEAGPSWVRNNDAVPIPVVGIYGNGWDDQWRFLAYGNPNLAKEYSPDSRIGSAFRPEEYASAIDAEESRKPHTQVVLGTEAVSLFMDEDSGFLAHRYAGEVRAYLESSE